LFLKESATGYLLGATLPKNSLTPNQVYIFAGTQVQRRHNMEALLTPQVKAMLASYGRSVLGAGIAAYTASGGSTTAVLNAVWAALIPVAMRYLNPNDLAFGKTK
jgi:hypothetical protein